VDVHSIEAQRGVSPITDLWRISNYADLSGEGSRLSSARWHTEGERVVYLAESLMDLDPEGILPRAYRLLRVQVSETCAIKSLEPPVGIDWKMHEESTRRIGGAWLGSLETPLARVPSAIAPYTWNYLLNPLHPDAGRVQVADVIKERFDNRLFRFGTR
jgi:RES domain-containing protein